MQTTPASNSQWTQLELAEKCESKFSLLPISALFANSQVHYKRLHEEYTQTDQGKWKKKRYNLS